jgi:hypothetical protein
LNATEQLARDGYWIAEQVASQTEVDALLHALTPRLDSIGTRGGVRHVLRDVPDVQRLAQTPGMRTIAEADASCTSSM